MPDEIEVVVPPAPEVLTEKVVEGTEVKTDDAPKGDEPVPTEEEKAASEEKHKSRNQRRLERARTAQAVAEAENKLLREQIEAGKPKAPETKEPPKREDFPDYEAYLDARADFRAEEKAAAIIKADREAQQAERAKAAPNAEHQELAKNWAEREKAFQAETADYQEVVTDFVQDPDGLRKFSDGARRLIVESDVGPAVLHQLATDQELAERIQGLSPVRQIAELGKLESKFTAAAPEAKTSKAPPPPTPAKGSKVHSKDPSKMSIDELDKLAAASGSRWARH